MIKPSLPVNEQARLEALNAYQVLDTDAEKAFDDLTLLASRICKTPIALVSLIDPERQWFKAKVGLAACETTRDIAFCAHAIHQSEIMEIPDTLEDERFWDNPLVTGAPFIRFYAGAPLISPEGYAIGTLCVISDQPSQLNEEQKEALSILAREVISQLELRKKLRELSKVSEFKSDFLSNMSHEIRTPINGISGTLHLLEELLQSKEQQQLVQLALSSAESILEIVNDILDLSRIEAGKFELQEETFSLSTLLSELGATHNIRANQKFLELICPASPLVVERVTGDALRLKQVLNNLISNAIKFTHEGAVHVDLRIESSADLPKDTVNAYFEVKDTGIGLTPQQAETLFGRYQQASVNTYRDYGGTGLGLNISKQLVALMGGEIGVYSQPHVGSTFWFRIPLAVTQYGDTRVSPELSNSHILVVHTGEATRHFFKTLFQHWQLVAQVTTAGEAYKMVKQCHAQPFTHLLIEDKAELLPNGLLSDQLINLYPDQQDTAPLRLLMSQPSAHSGRIDYSHYDAVVRLPLMPNELLCSLNHPERSSATTLMAPVEPKPLYKGRALVAEDNQTNQIVAKGLLEQFGLNVSIAADGYEALHLMRQHQFDIVFMDCQMPVMDGYKTTQELRQSSLLETSANVPVIALTGNVRQDDQQKCLDVGMNEFLTKPINPKKLAAVLSQFLTVCLASVDGANLDSEHSVAHPSQDAEIFEIDSYRLRLGGDKELMQLAMDAALEDFAGLLNQLLTQPDTQHCALLHQLKGLAGNCSATALYRLAQMLEEQCTNPSHRLSKAQIEALKAHIEQFNQTVQAALS